MRRRYRYNPATKEMELISESIGSVSQPRNSGVLICPDISPFKSIVDGTVITGRRALREHNKRNDVTFTEDFRGTWASKRKERDSMYSGDPKFDRKRRVEAIQRAIETNTRRR
jgi:hypothetical protein